MVAPRESRTKRGVLSQSARVTRKSRELRDKGIEPSPSADAQFDRFDKQQVAALNKAIKQVEAAIEKELRKDAETARTYELLCSVPGVGLVLAAYLMVKTAAFTRLRKSSG